jgi:hypothetical protein
MRFRFIAALVCLLVSIAAKAQECPKDNPNGPPFDSVSRRLTGKVVYHDEIRQWFELVLDSPTCRQSSVQLLQGGGAFEVDEGNAHAIEVFRGCHVTVEGPLGIPGTGYYSADIYQNADKIDPAKDCLKQLPLPDYSKSKPDRSVRSYRVRTKLDYTARGGHIFIIAQSGKRLLSPWQTYASYWLTGGYAFYGYCAEGFDMTQLRGTPEAKPWMVDNYAAMDPEGAVEKHIRWVTMEFTCRKQSRAAAKNSDQ